MKRTITNNKISISRNNLLNDAFDSIMNLSIIELKRTLRISYIGEEGTDAGGLLRDFFYQLSKEIGNPNYLLFKYHNKNSYELEINPKSDMADPQYMRYFFFLFYNIKFLNLKDNTVYEGYTLYDPTITYFWMEEKSLLLIFATGTSQIPATGFKDLQGNGEIECFKIKRVGNEKDLPVSHTW
ncbi:hypothetical protein H8356DRAFT_940448 [Neocallimastix lanati (nom. inval.)]|nr:hypothetical protein H8356DRAFT_940448 [Neocallimastix sp. JGI-2020a]